MLVLLMVECSHIVKYFELGWAGMHGHFLVHPTSLNRLLLTLLYPFFAFIITDYRLFAFSSYIKVPSLTFVYTCLRFLLTTSFYSHWRGFFVGRYCWWQLILFLIIWVVSVTKRASLELRYLLQTWKVHFCLRTLDITGWLATGNNLITCCNNNFFGIAILKN